MVPFAWQSSKSYSCILHPTVSLCFCSALLNRDEVRQQIDNLYQVLKTTENWQKGILFQYVKMNTIHLNAPLRERSEFPCIHRGCVSSSESESHSVVSDSLRPHGLSPLNYPGKNTAMGRLSLLQGMFPNQGSNPGLPLCRWILYQLSHREVQEYWRG